jgi:hypothetical protein
MKISSDSGEITLASGFTLHKGLARLDFLQSAEGKRSELIV